MLRQVEDFEIRSKDSILNNENFNAVVDILDRERRHAAVQNVWIFGNKHSPHIVHY